MIAALLTIALFLVREHAEAAGRPAIFTAPDGTPLVGTFYEPSARPAPAVILLHMLGRSKDDWDRFAGRLEDEGLAVLALDLRGHGRSGGSAGAFPAMVEDVVAAVGWLATRSGVRPDRIAVAGASLGANLAALAAADSAYVRAVALLSPSLDYRGVRIDANTMKKIGDRPVWLAASTEDPYAMRTLRDLVIGRGAREQRLSSSPAHGTNLLSADPDLARALVDWLRRTLIF